MASGKSTRKDVKRPAVSPSKVQKNKKVAIEDEGAKHEELVHKVLTEELCKELMEITDVNDIERKLCQQFNLNDTALDLKEGTLLDMYTAAAWWSTQQKLTVDQASGFFTIVHTLIDNIKEKNLPIVENLIELKKMIISSQERPCLFSVLQCQAITEYICNTLFHHYKLYEFMFGVSQSEEIIGADLEIEVLPPITLPYPAPLCEAITLEMFEDYITVQPDSDSLLEEETEEEDTEANILDAEILKQLTAEDVREVFTEVSNLLLSNVHAKVKEQIQSKETEYLTRINKIHNILP